MFEQFFMPFFAQFLLNHECTFTFEPSADLCQRLKSSGVPESNGKFELQAINQQQYLQFRYAFLESGVQIKGTDCDKANKLVLGVLALILCRRVPDLGLSNQSDLFGKVRLSSRIEPEPNNVEALIRQ